MSRRARGVTLIELIITIVILGIVSVVFGVFIAPAIRAHQAMERRAALVDATEVALRRMARDIRISVPHSLRVATIAGGFALEMVPTIDGARYCTGAFSNCDNGTVAWDAFSRLFDPVSPTPDPAFDVLGCFRNPAFVSGTAFRLVVNNSGGEIYTATGSPAVITPSTTTITKTTVSGIPSSTTAVGNACGSSSAADTSYRHHIGLAPAHLFPGASPRQRVFVVEDAAAPVTYICDANAGTLRRYAGYKVGGAGSAFSTASQPTNPAAAPLSGAATSALVAQGVTSCSAIATLSVTIKGLMAMTLALTANGETVQLMHQVQLDNSQ